MTDWLLLTGLVFVATLAAIAVYQWIRAEVDERRWRRMIDEELSNPMFTYRLVRDEGDDRG